MVPVTSNVARVYPFQVLLDASLTGLAVDSKAQAEQVRSIAVERVGVLLGSLSETLLAELDEALRLHLAAALTADRACRLARDVPRPALQNVQRRTTADLTGQARSDRRIGRDPADV